MSDDKSPLDHAVDLMVFAPIGFALEARKLLPTFVERGRQQVNMAKFVGKFAVQQGQVEATKRLTHVQHQAESVLQELGLGTLTGAAPSAAGITDDETDPLTTTEAGAADTPSTPASTPIRSSAAAADLPISDYDSLAASQVVPRLTGLSAEELEAVRAYEVAHRGRKTILGKVAQLSGE